MARAETYASRTFYRLVSPEIQYFRWRLINSNAINLYMSTKLPTNWDHIQNTKRKLNVQLLSRNIIYMWTCGCFKYSHAPKIFCVESSTTSPWRTMKWWNQLYTDCRDMEKMKKKMSDKHTLATVRTCFVCI